MSKKKNKLTKDKMEEITKIINSFSLPRDRKTAQIKASPILKVVQKKFGITKKDIKIVESFVELYNRTEDKVLFQSLGKIISV